MANLRGNKIVVTGAAGGLGRAVCALAEEQGASLVKVDVAIPEGAAGEWIAIDLLDREGVAERLAAAGEVDGLFHLAGGFDMGPGVDELSPEGLQAMIAINVTTLQNVLHAVVPGMKARRRGAIVTVGALSALKGQAHMGAYIAAKAMVMRLTESLSAEVRDLGINVNAVLPSIIDTPANRRDMPDADHARWVSGRALADVICFLGSDAAGALHGALIPVAGRV